MSTETYNNSSGGIGFTGLLTIVFITLKLTNCIDWSWWWVLCPLMIPVVIAVLIIGAFLTPIVMGVAHDFLKGRDWIK